MFLKNDLSNKKMWSNYAKPNAESCNDWQFFVAKEEPLSYVETGYRAMPENSAAFKDEQPPHLSTDSIERLNQWLNSLPDTFEIPRSQSPVTVRSLSDPVWRVMSDEEIATRGNGWDADFSLLKNKYGDAFQTSSKDELKKHDKKSSEMICSLDRHEKTARTKVINAIAGNTSLSTSASSNTTICNTMKNNEMGTIYREYSATSASTSPMMDAVCEGIQASSDETFYSADSRPQSKAKDPIMGVFQNCFSSSNFAQHDTKNNDKESNLQIASEHISHALPDTDLKGLPSNSSASAPKSLLEASSFNIMSDIPATAFTAPQAICRGNSRVGHTRKFIPKYDAPVERNDVVPAQSLIPVQPLVPYTSSTVAPIGNPYTTLNSAAYNNFLTWQWPAEQRPNAVNDQQATLPQVAHVIPLVPYLWPMNLFFARPNVVATTTPFYNNMILFRMLQQQALMQRQQQFATPGLFIQQQPQQQLQQQQQQQLRQHHTNQMRQYHLRNSRYKRPPRFHHNKCNNSAQKPNPTNNNGIK